MFQTNYIPHPTLTILKRLVVFMSLSYALLEMLFMSGTLAWSPSILFSWHNSSFLGYLIKTGFVSCVIPYPGITISMIFDFLFLGFFYAPIVSFILSYCGSVSFIYMWLSYAYISGISMMLLSHIFSSPHYPFSLFLNISYGMIIFWILMLKTSKSQPRAFFILPISVEWIFIISTFLCVFAPLIEKGISTAITSCIVGFTAYVWAITQYKMTSGIKKYLPFENRLKEKYYAIERVVQWHIMRNIRAFTQWVSQHKK